MSGTLALRLGLGAGVFTPVKNTYTTAVTGSTETVPNGASNVVIEVWGHGGSGGLMVFDGVDFWIGGGGGAGGYSRSSYSISGGQTLTYTISSGGTASTVSSGTKTITTLTANSGGSGSDGVIGGTSSPGGGGTASGGTVANTTGGAGTGGDNFGGGTPGTGVTGVNGGPYGGGGSGAYSSSVRDPGALGAVIFYYT